MNFPRRILFRSVLFSPIRSRISSLVTFSDQFIFSILLQFQDLFLLEFCEYPRLWTIRYNALNITNKLFLSEFNVQLACQEWYFSFKCFFGHDNSLLYSPRAMNFYAAHFKGSPYFNFVLPNLFLCQIKIYSISAYIDDSTPSTCTLNILCCDKK